MNEPLDIATEDDCWTFTLNRPAKMNALNADLIEALIEGVERAHASRARCLILKGAGKNFSAGFDFTDLDNHSDGDLLLRLVRIETLLSLIAALPCLTIALAHGRNFGAGADMFAVAKRRICTRDASFRMPGLRFGLVLGSRRLSDLVGQTQALNILERALSVPAADAASIGLATSLADVDEWPAVTAELVQLARSMDATTRTQLYHAVDRGSADRDLATLVRSAARPGIKARMQAYLRER
jgi:enoyl-CoA hydratase/carnithine racemase